MKNIVIAIVIAGLFIAGAVLYSRNQKLNRAIDLQTNTQIAIDFCMASAHDVYVENWNDACKTRGLGDDCQLYPATYERIDQMYKEAKDLCVERYK